MAIKLAAGLAWEKCVPMGPPGTLEQGRWAAVPRLQMVQGAAKPRWRLAMGRLLECQAQSESCARPRTTCSPQGRLAAWRGDGIYMVLCPHTIKGLLQISQERA